MKNTDFFELVEESKAFETCNIVASLLDNIATDVDVLYGETKEAIMDKDSIHAYLSLICKNIISIAKLLYDIQNLPSLEEVDDRAGAIQAAIETYHKQKAIEEWRGEKGE